MISAIERISKADLQQHLIQLDLEARHWRFGYAASDGAVESYVTGIEETDILLGIRSLSTSDVVAAMHLAFNADNKTAEMGISTLPDSRRRGYAERLMRYSVDVLRNRNITQLYSVCLPDNTPLLRLLHKLNITAVYSNDGDKEARIVIPMAGIDSILNEMRNERLIIIDKSMRPWSQLWGAILQGDSK